MPTIDRDLVERMRARLIAPDVDDDLLSALEQFGTVMFEELNGRISALESKATNILGWGTALLGFLLLRQPTKERVALWLLGAAVVAALVAVITAFVAVRSRGWEWPGVRHWFCEQEFGDPLRLRALHLTELLATYRLHARIADTKAHALVISQWAIVVAAILVGVTLFVGLS